MTRNLRMVAPVVVCIAIFASATALSGPRILSGSDLLSAVGAKLDCDTPGFVNPECPDKLNDGLTCPISQTYKRCKPKSPGNNKKRCRQGGDTCKDKRCINTATENQGARCNKT